MGEATILDTNQAKHLLRRTGFGVPLKGNGKLTLSHLVGITRGEAVDRLLDFRPKGTKPGGKFHEDIHNKWLKIMLKAKKGFALQEKLVLFWHDHFATGIDVVEDAKMMAAQNRTLRRNCKGDFKAFAKLINVDPAMMDYLDTVRNSKEEPNENYSRELCELFTLGVTDLNGNPNYDQEDVVQIARAFTGWDHDEKVGTHHLHEFDHDYEADFPARGPKVIFKDKGGFGNPAGQSFTVNGEGEPEIDAVIDIIFQHTDSDGENTVARHVTFKLFEYFAYQAPAKATIDAIIADSGFDVTFDVNALLRAVFVHDEFYATAAAVPPAGFDVSHKKSVKWPVDYVVTVMRELRAKTKGRELELQGDRRLELMEHLENMGQVLFQPPSVFGWDWEANWISSSALLARYDFVRDVISARDKSRFKPEKLIDTDLTDPGEIVDAVLGLLSLDDQLTPTDRQHLIDYLTDDGAVSSLDLNDYDVRNEKLHGLISVVLKAPQYLVH